MFVLIFHFQGFLFLQFHDFFKVFRDCPNAGHGSGALPPSPWGVGGGGGGGVGVEHPTIFSSLGILNTL